MLEKLTKEQEILMEEVRDEYLELFSSFSFNEKDAIEYVGFLYSLIDKSPPKEIKIFDSPIALQIACNEYKNKIEGTKGTNSSNYFFESYDDSWRNSGWVAFYDFFSRIGLVKNELFEKYMKGIKSNIFSLVLQEDIAFISKPPTKIMRDERKEMHCTTGPAIEFGDGYCQYYLWGVYFSPELFNKFILEKSFAPKEIFEITNQEQKGAVIKFHGYENLIKDLPGLEKINNWVKQVEIEGKLVTKDHVLYKYTFDERNGTKAYFIMEEDFSTDRKYFIGVPPCKNVEEALAWSYDTTFDQYSVLKIET